MYNTFTFSKIIEKDFNEEKPILELPLTKYTLKSIEMKAKYEQDNQIFKAQISQSESSETNSSKNPKALIDEKRDIHASEQFLFEFLKSDVNFHKQRKNNDKNPEIN